MRPFLCVCLLLLPTLASAATATCEVDLEEGSFVWISPDGERLDALQIEPGSFAALHAALAAGDPADSLRSHLSRSLVEPVWPKISTAGHWRIRRVDGGGLPGPLGGFAVLPLPDGEGARAVSLDPGTQRIASSGDTSGAILISAPFTPDVDPATDDPDTLRHALHRAARTVRLVPRNEIDVVTLQDAIEDARPSLLWIRAEADQVQRLRPAFAKFTGVIVWTVPSRSTLGAPQFDAELLGELRASCLIVSTRAASESTLAPIARALVDAMARGLDCGSALEDAQRMAREGGPVLASTLVLVGEPATPVKLARAPWLRRVFR